MNKYRLFWGTCIVIILLAGMSSCSKNNAPTTTFGRLEGSWKLIQTATDDNGNSTIDANELHNVPAGSSNVIKFSADSTGSEVVTTDSATTPTLNFSWMVTTGDSLWIAYSAHDTITYFISQINSYNLTLTGRITVNNNSTILAQYYYSKQ